MTKIPTKYFMSGTETKATLFTHALFHGKFSTLTSRL